VIKPQPAKDHGRGEEDSCWSVICLWVTWGHDSLWVKQSM